MLTSMILAACGGGAEPTPAPAAPAPTEAPAAAAADRGACRCQRLDTPHRGDRGSRRQCTCTPTVAGPTTLSSECTVRKSAGSLALAPAATLRKSAKEQAFVEKFNAKYGDKY